MHSMKDKYHDLPKFKVIENDSKDIGLLAAENPISTHVAKRT